MRLILKILLILLVVAATYQLYQLYNQQTVLNSKVIKLKTQTSTLLQKNNELEESLEYYQNLENLAKEFKSKFDYKKPGEELYIIIPKR